MLVDLGGPGRVLFAGTDAAEFSRNWPGNETLIFLEEPWVRAPLSPSCQDSLHAFYGEVHAPSAISADNSAKRLSRECKLDQPGLWGWSPKLYRDAVNAIAAKEQVHFIGAVSISFGATRSRWLSGLPLEWQILDSPSPYALDGPAYVAARTEAALTTLARVCATCADAASTKARLRSSVEALDSTPIDVPTRSLGVNGRDVEAALWALPYLAADGQRAAANAILQPTRQENADTIGALSDSVLLRYGVSEMSPAALAYLQEVCASFGGWNSSHQSVDQAVSTTKRLHQPCGQIPEVGDVGSSEFDAVTRCLARSSNDAVTPAEFAKVWVDTLHIKLTVVEPGDDHGTTGLAAACYRKLSLPNS